MAEKLTLTAYLAQRGVKAKALTKGEAALLGISYPLQRGWARKHGSMIIGEEMLLQLVAHAKVARQAAEERARRTAIKPQPNMHARVQLPLVSSSDRIRASPVLGFVLRLARRYRKSNSN